MTLATQTVRYQSGAVEHVGYLARPQDAGGTHPGIVVIHEWWGLNDYIRRRARQLAELGYCALAIDMYGEGQTVTTPQEAGVLMNTVLEDMEMGTERLKAGYETLLSIPGVEAERTAAIGYCFGGAMALHMARIGMPLGVVVSFHGALGAFHQPVPGEVKAKVLVCHGGADEMVSMEDVAAFRSEMEVAKADCEIIVHTDAMHGFSSREADENRRKYGIPVGYDATADRDSWRAMVDLLDELF